MLPRLRSTIEPPPGGGGPNVRGLVLANLMVLAIGVGFFLVYRFATVLFSLFTGVTLGMAVKPAVDWLGRRRIPRWAGALSIYLVLSALVAGFVVWVVPVVVDQLGTIVVNAPAQFER